MVLPVTPIKPSVPASIPEKRTVFATGKSVGRVVAVIHHVKLHNEIRQYHALVSELASSGAWRGPVAGLRARAARLAEKGDAELARVVAETADHLEQYGRMVTPHA